MKSKKLLLPIIILVVAVLLVAAFSVINAIAKKPAVTSAEFPFSITYELDGKTVTINDVYKARYDGNSGYADTKTRTYVGEIGDMGEGNTIYTLKQDESGRVELWTYLYADYLMGDPLYEYFDDEAFEPKIYYYNSEEQEFHDDETLSEQGVKLISYDYPSPIKNSFVFSHISYFSYEVVIPAVLIVFIAMIVTLIFVKKEKEFKYKAIDYISIVLNVLFCFTLLPFVTIIACLIDINGGGPEMSRQVLYFIPAFIVLCMVASIALRRKQYSKSALISGLIGPAAFGIYLIIGLASGLL